jgi:antitoxin (DNA-binding transcriptional repressor) of toxin-antitoxin stability system
MESVDIADLRRNLRQVLRRAARGERILVTDGPVAEVGPPPAVGDPLARLLAEDRVARPRRSRLPDPIELGGDPYALSRALDEIREDR